MHVVKIAFPYAHDGLNTELLAEGAEREFRPELVDGLKRDGYIGDIDTPAPDPVAEPVVPAVDPVTPVVEAPVVEPTPETATKTAPEKIAVTTKPKAK
jgi:hypothetical protein